jgi:hypothetical protein
LFIITGVSPDTTIGRLKTFIYHHVNHDYDVYQQHMLNGNILNDELNWTSDELRNVRTLQYAKRAGSGGGQIFVKNLDGKTLTLDVGDFATWGVLDVKHDLMLQTGTPVDEQRLIWSGRQLVRYVYSLAPNNQFLN